MKIDNSCMSVFDRLIEYGSTTLSDVELLTLIVGDGISRDEASICVNNLLSHIDSSSKQVDITFLRGFKGIGKAKAARIAAMFEFSRRIFCPGRMKISKPEDVLPIISHYAHRQKEHFLSISLNGAHEVIAVRVVSIGLLNRTVVHPREVFAEAITDRAAAIICAHNHPSGNNTPSREDREVTAMLHQSSKILGIPLLDHIIFTENGYYSFQEQGEI